MGFCRGEPPLRHAGVLSHTLGCYTPPPLPLFCFGTIEKNPVPAVPLSPQNPSLLLIGQDLPQNIICAPGSISAWGNYPLFPGTPSELGLI